MGLDHIFICIEPGMQQAEALRKFGLTEGPPNQHSGQGTANHRFFFRNAYLELLYLQDPIELQSELTKPTKLYERLTSEGDNVSPLGICFRPIVKNEKRVPFPSWTYKPLYLPAGLKIDIGDAPIHEPMWFFVSFASRPDQAIGPVKPPFDHPKGFDEITSLRITVRNSSNLSEPARCALAVKGIKIIEGHEHLAEIGFDGERTNESYDFRPKMPLILRW